MIMLATRSLNVTNAFRTKSSSACCFQPVHELFVGNMFATCSQQVRLIKCSRDLKLLSFKLCFRREVTNEQRFIDDYFTCSPSQYK